MKNKQDSSDATKIISIDEIAVRDNLNEVARDTIEEKRRFFEGSSAYNGDTQIIKTPISL